MLVLNQRLEAMPFWVALGARLFAARQLDIDLVWADDRGAAVQGLLAGQADVAVVPPEVGSELMATALPFSYVANLLAREPGCLIAHYDAVRTPLPVPLRLRLELMRGLRVGVTVDDEPRLERLFAEVGLSTKRTIALRRLAGDKHNVALASRRVDALFTRSPHLEKGLIYSRAVVVAEPPRGEVSGLNDLMVQAVLAHPDAARARGHSVGLLVAALQQAADLCRNDPERAIEALLEVSPERSPTELSPAVRLYASAIPHHLDPTPETIARTAALYLAAAPTPRLSDLRRYVDPRFARAASMPARNPERLLLPVACMAAAAGIGAWRGRRRGQSRPS